MILVPQIFIKAGHAVRLERTTFSLFDDDAFAMARSMVDAGTDALFITDLNISPVGAHENLSIITKIKKELKIRIFVGGAFRASQSIDAYRDAGVELIVLDAHAYQQPRVVDAACARFKEHIGVHIDVRGGRVTIPGWTVAANKTAYDYAERFQEQGVTTFLYSNMDSDERTGDSNREELLAFCKKVRGVVYCTNEITGTDDIAKLVTLGAPRLEGIILGRGLYQGRIDLRGANTYVLDLMLDTSNEPTLMDM